MQQHALWLKADGDKTLRLNYKLDEKSIVIDAGGYSGTWAADIYSKYKSTIYVFEPVKSFYDNIVKKFLENKNISVFNYGVSNKDSEVEISLEGDSCSVFKSSAQKEKIQLKSFYEFATKNNLKKIDLMKINIEGGEFDLLEDLIEKKYVSNIENIQVQFHNFFPEAVDRRRKIREELVKTHELTYDFEFIWENWKKKNG